MQLLKKEGKGSCNLEAPVFERFGLPRGQRGVILMSPGVRVYTVLFTDYG